MPGKILSTNNIPFKWSISWQSACASSSFAFIFTFSPFSLSAVTAYAAQAAHFILPVIALIVLIRCIASMFYGRAEPETWGHLVTPDGKVYPLLHWECPSGARTLCTLSRTACPSRMPTVRITCASSRGRSRPLPSRSPACRTT